jgi:branched-chain amino acid transport system substrate-binding protein
MERQSGGKSLVIGAVAAAFILSVCAPVSAKDLLKVGFVAPLTGPFADQGTRPRNTVQLMIDQINAQGGALLKDGSRIKLAMDAADDQGKIDIGGTAIRRLIEGNKADVVLGGLLSSVALAQMDIAENFQTPFIIVGAIAGAIGDKIAARKYHYVFQATPTSKQRAGADIDSILGLSKAKRIYVISQDTDFGRDMARVAKERVTALGAGYEVGEEFVKPGTTEYASQILKMRAFQPDFIYAPLIGQEMFSFMEQKTDAGIKTLVFGGSSTPASDNYIKTLGPKVANLTLTNLVWTPAAGGERAAKFAEAYKVKFGNSPADLEAQAYDGLLFVVDALRKADDLSRGAIANAIMQVEVDGLRGPHQRFDSERHGIPGLSFVIGQIQNGKYQIVWPKKNATAALMSP